MTELGVTITGTTVERYAAVPTLRLGLAIEETSGGAIDSLVLRTLVRIEPQLRRYDLEEQERLADLFGGVARFGDTLRPFLWTEVATTVAGFVGTTETSVAIMCTYDLEVAATKYFHALRGGVVPLRLLFSGTVFRRVGDRRYLEPIPWHLEASYAMDASIWHEMMDLYFPDSGWLRLSRATLDQLAAWKTARTLPSFEQALVVLLEESQAAMR